MVWVLFLFLVFFHKMFIRFFDSISFKEKKNPSCCYLVDISKHFETSLKCNSNTLYQFIGGI